MSEEEAVPIRTEPIRLGQFLKLAGAIGNGSDVKPLLEEGLVEVNATTERRRGRQLVRGDLVVVAGRAFRVG
jgi:ribosome-associated protein